jgi:hypothetical protein
VQAFNSSKEGKEIMQQSPQKNKSKKPKESLLECDEKKFVSSGTYVDHI